MNKERLDKLRYDRTKDPYNLMVTDSTGVKELPAGRCFCCARIFYNAKYGIAYCRECDELMSCSSRGAEFDFQFMIHPPSVDSKTGVVKTPPNPLIERGLREPIPFEMEEGFRRAQGSDFKLATGKPIFVDEPEEIEDERIKRLYDLR